LLRRPQFGGARPPHVFITQNGDWALTNRRAEFRFFGCEGLVCTNPDYYERNKSRWNSRLIPNGVDVRRFQPGPSQRESFGLPPDATIVLMVSAAIASKRVDDGIEAVSRMAGAHLVVAGDGPMRQQLIDKAAALLPGRFTLMSVPPARMPDLYRSADVFLHMSFEEAFGNVYIEALACGLPVVGHDAPRLRWIVGDEGFLVDTRDPGQVAQVLSRAVEGAAVGRENRVARAAQFSWTRVGQMYREFLQTIVASSRAMARKAG
jgi:glycosyltransferase involved in cell wall biosynthesis